MLGIKDGRTERKEQDMAKEQVKVDMFNWGPCVVRIKISEEFRKLQTRVVDLHPVTMMQNARTSGGGVVTGVPGRAITVGPVQTFQAEKVSIWHAGTHDNAFGMRLTSLC